MVAIPNEMPFVGGACRYRWSMRIRFILPILCLAVLSCPGFAADAPPTDESIRQLMDAMHTRKTLDTIMTQMDQMMSQMMSQVTQGQKVSPAVQKSIESGRGEAMSMMKEILDWRKLEPMYIRVYQKSFTQKEVNDLTAMYRSPAGETLINKLPVVMQNTMAEMQPLMQPIIQKMQRTQQQVAAQVQAEKEKHG
jgi:hypothetical protein